MKRKIRDIALLVLAALPILGGMDILFGSVRFA